MIRRALMVLAMAMAMAMTADDALACRPTPPLDYDLRNSSQNRDSTIAIACVSYTYDIVRDDGRRGWGGGRATIVQSLSGRAAITRAKIGSIMCDAKPRIAKPKADDQWVVYFFPPHNFYSAYPLELARKVDPRLPAPSNICNRNKVALDSNEGPLVALLTRSARRSL